MDSKEWIDVQVNYSFPSLSQPYTQKELDMFYGVMDIETFTSGSESNQYEDIVIRPQKPYAIGYLLNDAMVKDNISPIRTFYIDEAEYDSDRLILNFIHDLQKHGKKITLFAHNLGKFDGIILCSTLTRYGYKIDTRWVDENKLYKIVVTTPEGGRLTFIDSLNILNSNLGSLAKSFKSRVLKGHFPYNFVNEATLNYFGKTPHFSYYSDFIDYKEYIETRSDCWDLKAQCIQYLESDLRALLFVLNAFNGEVYKDAHLNITKYNTISSITYNVFMSSYYETDHNLVRVRGNVESFIRKAYYGGTCRVFKNELFNGFTYDKVSIYPSVMLNDMPVGNPKLVYNINIKDDFFGFVKAKVLAPPNTVLKNTVLPYRDPKGVTITYPRGCFEGVWFFEELKHAHSLGYKVSIEYGFSFQRGKGLFNKYINEIFPKKKLALDPVSRITAKLMLNSLYGRFGIRDRDIAVEFVGGERAWELENTYNLMEMSEIYNDLYLVKYNKKAKLSWEVQNDNGVVSSKPVFANSGKAGGSSVHISAAITAYARIEIAKFMNIPGNECFYTDTDSVVIQNMLPDTEVGDDLGKIRLEYIVRHGIFIREKLYCLLTNEYKLIKKASGVDSKSLTYSDYISLLAGNNVTLTNTKFFSHWNHLTITINDLLITLRGVPSSSTAIIIYNKPHTDLVVYSPSTNKNINYIPYAKRPFLPYDPVNNTARERIKISEPKQPLASKIIPTDWYRLYNPY